MNTETIVIPEFLKKKGKTKMNIRDAMKDIAKLDAIAIKNEDLYHGILKATDKVGAKRNSLAEHVELSIDKVSFLVDKQAFIDFLANAKVTYYAAIVNATKETEKIIRAISYEEKESKN